MPYFFALLGDTVDSMVEACHNKDMKRNEGQFKKGQHWRKPKPFWDKNYLFGQYRTMQKSASEIAAEHECTERNILYWLKKHGIPRRSISEARQVKHWGLVGSTNGMYNRRGDSNPNWRGGITPERQTFYASQEWAEAVVAIWKRDNATCQRCLHHRGSGLEFHIHHIKSFACVALRAYTPNLVLLCKECHGFIHSKANVKKEFICD
jgi:hypothetical protein